MGVPGAGRPKLDLESWLVRKIKHRNLRGLPPYLAVGGGIVHQPEPYARLLLATLRDPRADRGALDRVRDDARAFRSWVEVDQLDLIPARPASPPSPSFGPPR